MALRAGYYGLKGSVKRILTKLAEDMKDVVIIKSIGPGLTLNSAGELSADAQSVNYSLTEFDTGKKWINGKTIYGKVVQPEDKAISTSWVNLGASGIGANVAEMIITIKSIMSDAAGNEWFPVPDGTLDLSFNKTTDIMYVKSLGGNWDHGPKWVYIEYTKVSETKKRSTKK